MSDHARVVEWLAGIGALGMPQARGGIAGGRPRVRRLGRRCGHFGSWTLVAGAMTIRSPLSPSELAILLR